MQENGHTCTYAGLSVEQLEVAYLWGKAHPQAVEDRNNLVERRSTPGVSAKASVHKVYNFQRAGNVQRIWCEG